MIVAASASGAGLSPAASSLARTKRSMGCFAQVSSEVLGSVAACGETSDQCGCHGAPCSIQRRTSAIWSGSSFLCVSGGGMTSSSSLESMRWKRVLLSGWPLMTVGGSSFPFLSTRAAKKPASVSRRRPTLRVPGSGPWQWKQFSATIGRMSRLNSTFSSAAKEAATRKGRRAKRGLRMGKGCLE